MSAGTRKIVVIGSTPAVLEAVSDLLELAGYDVTPAGTWVQVDEPARARESDLAILDLSDWPDSIDLPEQILLPWSASGVPVLLLSLGGDERIWKLQKAGRDASDGRVEVYAQSLLGPDAWLDKVKRCLGE